MFELFICVKCTTDKDGLGAQFLDCDLNVCSNNIWYLLCMHLAMVFPSTINSCRQSRRSFHVFFTLCRTNLLLDTAPQLAHLSLSHTHVYFSVSQ